MRCLLKFMNFINGDVIDKYQLDSIDFCNAPPKEIENFRFFVNFGGKKSCLFMA